MGGNYSTRIWGNADKLAEALKSTITEGLMSGSSYLRTAQKLTDCFAVGFSQAARLVRTESSYIANCAEMRMYKDAGIERYRYLATLEKRTCERCGALDGKEFAVTDEKVGKNAPPLHPHCRCTTIAVLDDDSLKSLERSAKEPRTGSDIKVRGDMTFEEWKAWQAAGCSKDTVEWLQGHRDGLKKEINNDTMMLRRRSSVDNAVDAMPSKQLHRIVKAFRRNGGLIQMNDAGDAYLRIRHAEGITYNANTIVLHSNPSRAAVFEELIHAAQYRMGLNSGTQLDMVQCEVWAKEKLIAYSKAYGLSQKEVEITRRLLEQDKKALDELKGV
ncbi:MAG: minor capsid protein [Eubacteriales bacterium]|nr:minor capsid protein [Eubacteriales bacterium]MDD3881214.1 minor capsid protein [Eubacteriales bacterium]MDD4512132.1 minor capsid protein [Eubacteriales bacterium]